MMVMSDGGVRWLVFNQKTTENTIKPLNTPFEPSEHYCERIIFESSLPKWSLRS